jgi:hypothetical protein
MYATSIQLFSKALFYRPFKYKQLLDTLQEYTPWNYSALQSEYSVEFSTSVEFSKFLEREYN